MPDNMDFSPGNPRGRKQDKEEAGRRAIEREQVRAVQIAMRGRLSVVQTVYFQQPDVQPISFDNRYSRIMETEEEPYTRQIKVGANWEAVDTGWVNEVSMIILENLEGGFIQVQPTDEQRKEAAARIVEVGYIHGSTVIPVTLIRPRRFFPMEPVDVKEIRIRCQSGTARCRVVVIPK